MKSTKYTQCGLKKQNRFIVSWIPTKFAQLNKIVKLKKVDNTWDDGWIVEWVGQTEDLPEDYRKAIREHRRATGDSLPKL